MKFRRPPRFRLADSAQQVVGGFLLAGPFVVTEEVWDLATNMSLLQALITICLVAVIGYATLYKADTTRDPDVERDVAGVPIRFLSLLCVSFGSVLILALLFDAPDTFLETNQLSAEGLLVTFKAVSVGSVFSVVGAATADSVFSK
ncbi:DUF2391 family protein [Natronorubrum sulfidifaciens]|uniref:Integral membrane protein n=1 Tax=Natronorubrum sulfidifaciens JCM 14089 TaxID=1230460 RepID=L9WB41_9EURY|nr:DUF2391 family protein [Natronorubrum sulfidifaciens]ELY46720.1 hypothetical protein C495_06418 [Natronorubrum sulfidifaciens JCM 14089]